LEFEIWNLEFGTWNLELGIWNLEFLKPLVLKSRVSLLPAVIIETDEPQLVKKSVDVADHIISARYNDI
jgi:hypothetical protein